jgi:hypothetical protein
VIDSDSKRIESIMRKILTMKMEEDINKEDNIIIEKNKNMMTIHKVQKIN